MDDIFKAIGRGGLGRASRLRQLNNNNSDKKLQVLNNSKLQALSNNRSKTDTNNNNDKASTTATAAVLSSALMKLKTKEVASVQSGTVTAFKEQFEDANDKDVVDQIGNKINSKNNSDSSNDFDNSNNNSNSNSNNIINNKDDSSNSNISNNNILKDKSNTGETAIATTTSSKSISVTSNSIGENEVNNNNSSNSNNIRSIGNNSNDDKNNNSISNNDNKENSTCISNTTASRDAQRSDLRKLLSSKNPIGSTQTQVADSQPACDSKRVSKSKSRNSNNNKYRNMIITIQNHITSNNKLVQRPQVVFEEEEVKAMRTELEDVDHYKEKLLNTCSQRCICARDVVLLRCCKCHKCFRGRVDVSCPVHSNVTYLMDMKHCPSCRVEI